MSDAIPLPARPSLEHYKKQAKDLLAAVKAGDVRAWIDQWHAGEWLEQRLRDAKIAQLSDAQFFLARVHGFDSWPKFAKHVEALRSATSHDALFESAADAIVSGDIETLTRLLREHAQLVHARSSREHASTLLHYVSANGIEDFRQKTPPNVVAIAKLLLDCGADVNAESRAYGGHSTALGLAATSIHPMLAGVQIDLLRLLLDRGAIIETKPGEMVDACLANGAPEAAEYLLTRGAQLDVSSAAGLGRFDLVVKLLGDQPVPRGAFRKACRYGRAEIVQYLLAHGADVDSASDMGMTALHLAAMEGHLDVVKTLIAHGANLEAVNGYGGTVLGQTVWSAIHDPKETDVEMIRILVDAGARVDEDWFTGRAELDAALHPTLERVRELRRVADRARSEGRFEDACRDYVAAVDLCRTSSNRKLTAHTLRHLGDIECEMGRNDLAEPHLVEALEIARRENVSTLELANTIRPLALVRDDVALWEEARALYERANVQAGVDEATRRIARLRD